MWGCAAIPQQLPTCSAKQRVVLNVRKSSEAATAATIPVRGRKNLPSGTSPLLPKHISTPHRSLPLFIQADIRGTSVQEYTPELRQLADEQLCSHGAILFRGLPVSTAEDFSTLITGLGYSPLFLGGGGTARSIAARGVRSASDEPADHTIEPHQDMAHNPVAPAKLAFFMLHEPPEEAGGETILTDMRAVTRDAQEAGIIHAFERNGGVRYTKTLWSMDSVAGANTTFTWQRRFFTHNRSDVDRTLAQLPNDRGPTTWRWDSDDTLHYESILPACIQHNQTGETVFFNGIHTNHRDYFDLAPHIDTSLGSPYDTSFGNNLPIPSDMLDKIRAIWWSHSVALALKTGDVALVDNVLTGHGRFGWTPSERRVMLLSHLA